MKEQNGYMLLFRGTDWYEGLSPEQMQQVANHWMAWFNGLREKGTVTAGSPLEPQGKMVAERNGRVSISDGPFVESKETIGGYFLLNVGTFEEALDVARSCPGLRYGVRVEVRPVAAQCPLLNAEPPAEPALAMA